MRLSKTCFLITIQPTATIQAAAAAAAATPWVVPPPEDIRVRNFTHSGNGCPQSSINFGLSPNRTLMTYGLDGMSVHIGPGITPIEKQKNCQLHTSLESRTNSGGSHVVMWSFAVASVTYKVLARLDRGVNLTVSGAWWSNPEWVGSFSYTVNNPDGKDSDYVLRFREDKNVPPDERIWTPCGVGDMGGTWTMNLRARLESANATASGEIFGDDILASGLTVQVGLDWRQCNT